MRGNPLSERNANPHHRNQDVRTVNEISNLEQEFRDLEIRIGDLETALSNISVGGGSGIVIESFSGSKNATPQATTTSYADITGWTQNLAEASYTFNTTTGEVTFAKAGNFLVIVDVQGDQTGNNRTQLDVQLQVDTGGGYGTNAQYQWSNYATRNTAQDEGGVHGAFIATFAVGDKIKVQMQHIGVAMTVNQDEARLYIARLAV